MAWASFLILALYLFLRPATPVPQTQSMVRK